MRRAAIAVRRRHDLSRVDAEALKAAIASVYHRGRFGLVGACRSGWRAISAYPARLEAALKQRLPGVDIKVTGACPVAGNHRRHGWQALTIS